MLFQLTMFPTSKRGTKASVSSEVARVIDIIDRSGLPYKVGPMSTTIEGSWDKVIPLINKARLSLRRRHSRIYINITIDDRKVTGARITGKVNAIEKRLGREVKK